MTYYKGSDDSSPILLSGVYRSGTTFLAALLGAHPKLKATSSTVKFLRFCYKKYGDLNDLDNLKALVGDTKKRIGVRWEISLDTQLIYKELSRFAVVDYPLVYDVIMRTMLISDSEKGSRWVEKLAMQWSDIPTFLEMFPKGQVIHIVRDPRDVTASYKHMTFEKGVTYLDAAFNCRSAMESIREYERKYSNKRLLVVRAEDIAEQPRFWVEKICNFLEIEYSGHMLNTDKLYATGENWASNTSYDSPYKEFPKVEARWPKYLTEDEVLFVEMIVQPYMTSFGYKASCLKFDASRFNVMGEYLKDSFIQKRFNRWVKEGKGSQGYRSDPYLHEMRIVFPEKFK